jgi:hypothetical protein
MKHHIKTFGKLFIIGIVLIVTDVIINYLLQVSYSLIHEGIANYYVQMGVVRMFFVTLGFYFFVAGWAYLLAVILFHFYRTTSFLKNNFIYVILLFFIFYLVVNYKFMGVSIYLIGYFIIITSLYFIFSTELLSQKKQVKAASIFFIIFFLFFYFYWLFEERDFIVLAEHIIAYIPLAWIGQKAYAKLFPNQIAISKEAV